MVQETVTETLRVEADGGADTATLILAMSGSSALTLFLFFVCWRACGRRRLARSVAEKTADEDGQEKPKLTPDEEEASRQSKDQLLLNTCDDLMLKGGQLDDGASLLEK